MMMLIDPYRYGGSGPVSCDYIGAASGSGAGTTHAVNVPAGEPHASRCIFINIHWMGIESEGASLLSATIGGVAADIAVQRVSNTQFADMGCAIIAARMPVGATVPVSLTFSASVYSPHFYVSRAVNVISTIRQDAQANGGVSTPRTLPATCDVKADGVVFMASNAYWGNVDTTLNGVTRNYNEVIIGLGNEVAGGSALTSSDEAAKAFSSVLGGSGSSLTNHINIVASFR